MPITIGKKPGGSFTDPLGLLSDCHRRIERFLATLITVTGEAQGGPLTHAHREALATATRYFREAAPLHKEDEERSLFPRMRDAHDREVEAALGTIATLEEDHVVLDRGHVEADALLELWLTSGSLSSHDVHRLGTALEELQAIYQRHIAIEDRDVFPLAARILNEDSIAVLGREMAARRGVSTGDRNL